jgi:hypothetical protein
MVNAADPRSRNLDFLDQYKYIYIYIKYFKSFERLWIRSWAMPEFHFKGCYSLPRRFAKKFAYKLMFNL